MIRKKILKVVQFKAWKEPNSARISEVSGERQSGYSGKMLIMEKEKKRERN